MKTYQVCHEIYAIFEKSTRHEQRPQLLQKDLIYFISLTSSPLSKYNGRGNLETIYFMSFNTFRFIFTSLLNKIQFSLSFNRKRLHLRLSNDMVNRFKESYKERGASNSAQRD